MKKIYLSLLTGLFIILFANNAKAQLTGTKNIPGDYADLATAITDLNTQGVGAGGVTFNIVAGNPQTAIAGGYVIGGPGSAIIIGGANPTSAANPVIITGNGNTITAFAGQTAGLVNDAVFKLVGADYIILQNMVIQENGANTTTAVATNNMTEWGVALLYVTTTDGSQNNTIQNNTISLNRNYGNTFGIYSSNRHTAAAPTATAEITAATGANSPNKVYNNQISNVNFGIVMIGSGTPALMDNANDIGGASAATGNTITNWGGLAAASAYVGLTANNLCIAAYNQNGENISYNTIMSAAVTPAAVSEFGILKNYAAVPTGTFTSTISNNTITITSSPTTGGITAINCQGITTFLGTATITIDNNTITSSITGNVGAVAGTFLQGILNLSLAGTVNITNNKNIGSTINASGAGMAGATWLGISNSTAACGTLNITGNLFRNGSTNTTTGQFQGIVNSGAVTTAININNNKFGDAIGNCFTSTVATSGAFFGVITSASGAACTHTINNNDFRGIIYSASSTSGVQFITTSSATARSVALNINNNTFTNITLNTTAGNIFFIANSHPMTATGSQIINNNSIVGTFTKSGSGGTVLFMQSTNLVSPNGSTVTNTGNNFSNVSITGITAISGWNHQEGVSTASGPTKTITGNTFSNITSTGTGALTIITSNFGNNNSTVSSNTISNITGRAGITAISIGTSNGGATQTFSNNIISNLSSTVGTAAVVVGITGGAANITTTNINNNTISALSSAGTAGFDVRGIFTTAGATANVFKNKLYDLNATSTGSVAALITGNATAGTTTNVYNNYVGRCYAPASGFYQAVTGININQTAANNNNIYYNTIYLDGSCGGQSYCLYTNSANPAMTLRNNILVNNVTATGGSLVPSIVYFRNGTLTPAYSTASNNNIMYCGTPSATNLIYADGAVNALTNTQQTLAAFQAFVGPTRENLSKTENPPFINTTIPANLSYLHVNPTIATQAESGAVNILPYTDDYDGNIRATNGGYTGSGTAPDIGADEFDVTVDNFGPEISYTLLTSSVCTSSKTFTATITDYSGVNVTAGTLPRVYYKKSTNANTLGGTNNNTTDGWKYAEAVFLGGSSFSFTIDYTLVFGGVAAGDNIQYFVTAQDLFTPVNVGINSGTFAATPASVALTGAAFPLTGTINNYSIVLPVPTAITIGVAGTYTSLSGAGGLFADLNTKGLSGNTVVNIIDLNVVETGANALNQMVYDCGGPYTLTIKPANAAATVITGVLASAALLKIRSSNVIIDGSFNGTNSRDLTIANTSPTAPTVIGIGSTGTTPVTNTTVKNCVIINGAITATAVVVSDGTTLGSAGYFNNITIQNNSIQKAYNGIYAIASVSSGNGSGLTIQDNVLNTSGANAIGHVGIYVQGVDGATVSGNDVGNLEAAISEVDAGIWFATGTRNSVIEKNNIHDIKYTGTAGYGGKGVMISTGQAAANVTVKNNMIYGITGDGDDYTANGALFDPVGIYAFGTGQGGINIYYNSIYLSGATINFSINAHSIGIALDDNTTATLKDNIVKNELGLLAGTGFGAVGIAAETSASQFISLDYNDYYTNAPSGINVIGKIAAANYLSLSAWQTATGQEANSLNANPIFTSATDLHLVSIFNCELDGYGTPIAGITNDYDNNTRDVAAPDMGADEFTAVYSGTLAGIAGSAVCANKTVSPLGTTYGTGSCQLIAYLLPSGGSPVTGKVNVCVTLDATLQYFNGEPYVQRHHDLEPATSPVTATGTITLYYTDAEFDNYNTLNPVWPKLPTFANGGNGSPFLGNVRITQFHGTPTGGLPTTTPGNYTGTRVLITPSSVTYNAGVWTVVFPVTGFSGFYLHTTMFNTPLPITVNYLNGRRQSGRHLLDWKVTCIATPRATMTLERSADGRNYSGIYTITADANRCNQPFDYTDANPLNGMNYYRLKIVDADGKITYSTTVALLNAAKGFDIISIAPNPVVADNFKLHVTSAQASKMDIAIFDMQGRLVNRQTVSVIAGFNKLDMNVANLASGTYTLQGSIADDRSKVIRFVKQ